MSTHSALDRYLPTYGARLRWRLEGAGPALVLLHGWALDLTYWEPAVAPLARHFTVLRFDRRGFGLSAGLPDIRCNVDDLHALLTAAGIDRAALIGMSQGARLALHFACRYPLRVRGLVLDGAPAVDAEPELPMEQFRQELERGGVTALRARILAHPLMQLREATPEAGRLMQEMLARYRGLDLQNPVPRADAPDLAAIHAPTLILNGSHDSTARREASDSLRAAIAGAKRLELPNAGHLALLDAPAAYVAAVSDFCRGLI
jgi:3-oxoadipate enol-lactonase